jgi:alkylation response protein AidB-like acyl-CoA dehydrogenase
VCTSSSLIPAVNKLGTMPLIVGADDDLLGRYLPQVASGEAMFSYALSEREAGSDAASMKCRAVAGDGGWVLNGQKSWITNAGISAYYTVMAVTEQGVGPAGDLGLRRARTTTPASRWARPSASSGSTARPPARSSSRTAGSPPTGSWGSRAPGSRPRCAPSTTPG